MSRGPTVKARFLSRAVFLACSLASLPLSAQATGVGPLPVPASGRNLASNEDTTALVTGPANLAFLPATELRWVSAYLDEAARLPWQGHAFALGLPLPLLPLGTGLRLDLVSPPAGARPDWAGAYQWLTWGLGVRASESAALGFSFARTYSERAVLHGLSSWSAAMSLRPWPALAVGAMARHANHPSNRAGTELSPSYEFGVAVRPWGTRAVELGGEIRWVDDPEGSWRPRATLGFDLPRVGRLRADLEVSPPGEPDGQGWLMSASLAFYLNSPTLSSELALGSTLGSALGPDAEARPSQNLQAEAALKGWREPDASEAPRQALRVRIEDTPDAREHVALLRRLWSVADEEPGVDAVLLELRAAPARYPAWAEELWDALRYLRQHGKRVVCHLEDADGWSLYICSAADRILVNPAGGLRFAGLKAQYFYYASLFRKLGVRADFVRIGAHKSAPEAFTRDRASDQARADKIDLLRQVESQFLGTVASGRRLEQGELRERIARGPFLASEAQSAGLVDAAVFNDQLESELSRVVGRPLLLVEAERAPLAPRRFVSPPRIALVYATGDLIDGRSRTLPLLDLELLGSYTLAETLKQVREDDRIRAVVLRVDSPGGSALAADVIFREVELTAQRKPVVVSLGGVAASGGYYLAAPGTRLFASSLSITGSIGVFYGKADVAQLLDKIGVTAEVYKTAPRADMESLFRPYTSDERRELERKVRQFYEMFLSRVSAGRRLSTREVDAAGQGRVWTGSQALERRLVDELGGLRQALDCARRLAHLPRYAAILELPERKTSLVGKLLGLEGMSLAPQHELPRQLLPALRELGPFLVFSGAEPLARLEVSELPL